MALENVRPGRRITALESFVVTMAAAERYRFVTTPEYGQTIACADHTSVYFNHTAPLRGLAGALLWMAQHEMEHHGDTAAVMHTPTVAEPDATAVIPLVASAGNRPQASAIHGASTNGSIPPGTDWTALAGVGLDVRHRAGRAVPVHRVDYADGSQVFTLPADGFPGATWEIRASAPYVPAAPFRATGPAPYRAEDHAADVCTRCGLDVTKDPARMVLPPPLGSLSATHPATLCGSCSDGLVELVNAYVRSEPAPATGPAVGPIATGGFTNVKENAATTGDYCRHCDVFIGFGGAGVAREPEGMSPEWLAAHCWVCRRSAHELQAEAAGKCPNCLATLERCNAGGCGQRQAPGWRVAQQNGNGMEVRG